MIKGKVNRSWSVIWKFNWKLYCIRKVQPNSPMWTLSWMPSFYLKKQRRDQPKKNCVMRRFGCIEMVKGKINRNLQFYSVLRKASWTLWRLWLGFYLKNVNRTNAQLKSDIKAELNGLVGIETINWKINWALQFEHSAEASEKVRWQRWAKSAVVETAHFSFSYYRCVWTVRYLRLSPSYTQPEFGLALLSSTANSNQLANKRVYFV